ncbi:S41 family peptidase [Pyxidicoccus xibeiensis]|uniref:S41 family peptidase n=1 Tax=Pyxidicoccus xibeiensis TaxID=2906759 RepID=UPI0020A7AFFF|nr:S41 family peptidase [Pyxidicoccus xibeiensis]MCP3136127.1 S41 family peptidase [Pyxidicoccus xibeiensis]
MPERLCHAVMLAGVLATASAAASEATPPTDGRPEAAMENAAALGRVWGTVKYVHPALAFREVDWDAALVEALPQALAAPTPEALANAVGGMLRRLDDPLTRVERDTPRPPPPTAPAPGPFSRWSGDVLVVDLDRRYANLNELFPAMSALAPELAKARRVLVDLRASGPDEALWMEMALGFLERSLPSEQVTAPAERFRVYSGFPVQLGPSSGGYTASVETRLARSFAPAPGTPKRSVAFLVNGRTPLSPLLLALRDSPRTFLVSQGALDESSAVQVRHVPLPGGHRAVVRASELAFPPGSRGLRAEATVPADADERDAGPAFQAALHLLRKGSTPKKPAAHASTRDTTLPTGGPDDAYEAMPYPAEPYRLLAVLRFWNVMRFFHPDPKALKDWDAVLPTFLARARDARDAAGYTRVLYALAARVADGHSFVAEGGVPLRSLAGGNAPLVLRSVEGRFLVAELPMPEAARAAGISVGDEVVSVDGEPVATRAGRLGALLGASHPAAHAERVASLLLAGADGQPVEVMLQGVDGRMKEARLPRSRDFLPFLRPPPEAATPWRKLDGGLGYVDLRLLRAERVDAMLEALKDTRGLVLDLRGYPQGSAWALAPRLNVRGATTAAVTARPLLSAGEVREVRRVEPLPTTDKPLYRGRIVVLVDERTMSQGEYTAMMLRTASGARLVGSPTAGAVGDTTNVCLPGAVCVLFTGQRLESSDGGAVQGVGLRPDVEARPTVRGLRAGRDEVLERALTLFREEPPLAAGAR